jgi:hypothetical protein
LSPRHASEPAHAASSRAGVGSSRWRRRKKTSDLDAGMIETVRLFDTRMDTAAIQRASREAIEDREVEHALNAVLAEGRFRALYR